MKDKLIQQLEYLFWADSLDWVQNELLPMITNKDLTQEEAIDLIRGHFKQDVEEEKAFTEKAINYINNLEL